MLSGAGFTDLRFLTYKQAQTLGGNVKRGERGLPITLWKWVDVEKELEDGSTEKRRVPFLRYFTVFNAEQCEGLALPPLEQRTLDFDPIAAAEGVIEAFTDRPRVRHDGGDRAFYTPALDEIRLPAKATFSGVAEYYSTLFHELGHSTGHESRLDRRLFSEFGCESYSKEELVAEFTAAFLCAEAGIDNTLENSAAYVQNWAKVLRGDKKLVVQAAGQAQKAADYILSESEVSTDA